MGLGQPVALMIDEDSELRDKVSQRGFRVFTDEETFKSYVGFFFAARLWGYQIETVTSLIVLHPTSIASDLAKSTLLG